MMENKITYGIIGALSLLAAFGGYIYLSQEELDNSYYCPSTGEWGIFYGGVSSTGLTAYPFLENRTQYVRCTNSKWVLLKDYAKELGINESQLMEMNIPKEVSISWGKKYKCNQNECKEYDEDS